MAFQNFFAAKLFTDVGAADTTITLDTAPTATSGRMVLEARNPTQREVIKYTGVSGNQLTGVTRGVGGTTAKSHLKNALVEMNATAEDLQDLYDAFNSFSATNGSGWFNAANTPSLVLYNGNRSYDVTFTGVDLTNIFSPDTRIRTTRNTAAPTQSTLLNGTTQYLSKSSPAGMTFTDDFVVSAWVKLNAYGGVYNSIISRSNNTSGFNFWVNPNGQLELYGNNGGSSNYSSVRTVGAIPLGEWVHVAAQLDMSAFTATATTSYVMVNGAGASVTVQRGGTNPTALVQAGNLEVGSVAGGSNPWNGALAQVAVFNSKVTQATMRGYISQGLTGSETSLISAYSLSNSVNDLNTTNANNLTANGSATTTNADAPFGTQSNGTISSTLDYGIVTSAVFSGGNTTLTVQTPAGNTITTSGTISAVSYSNALTPYGFPYKNTIDNRATRLFERTVGFGYSLTGRVTRKGDIVTVSMNSTSSTIPAGDVTTILETMPLGFRPATSGGGTITGNGIVGAVTSMGWHVSSTGAMGFGSRTAATGPCRVIATGSWMTADPYPEV